MNKIPFQHSVGGEARASSTLLMLTVICGAQFLVVIDAVALMVASPALSYAFRATESGLQWVFNAYALAFGGMLLLAGRAGDRLGHRRVFAAGATVFALSSLLGAISQSLALLIAARALQGLGAALIAANSLALLTLHFPAGTSRHRALGLYASSATMGVASGTLIGGSLTALFDWPSVLLINVPIGLAMAWATLITSKRMEREPTFAPAPRMDWAGAIMVTLGFTAFTLGVAELGSPVSAAMWLAGAVALLGTFGAMESRSKAPLLDLRMFKNRRIAKANGLIFLHSAGPLVMLFQGSHYFQQVRHMGSLETGILFVPMAIGSLVGARCAVAALGRLPVRLVTALGFALMGVASLALAGLPATPQPFVVQAASALAIGGFGSALSFVCLTATATSSVPAGEAGMASGVVNTSLQIGGASMLAVILALADDVHSDSLGIHASAFTTASYILLASSAASLLALSNDLDC